MNNRFKKSFSTMMLAALVTLGIAPSIQCTPTHTSMMGSVLRNGSALAVNLAGMLCTGLKYSLYAGLGLTSVASYTARTVTDSKVALGVLGATGAYYGFYAWYLQDFFAIAKKYKPIFETDVTKQSDSDDARLIRFVNEHYDKKAVEIMENTSSLDLNPPDANSLYGKLNKLQTEVNQGLSLLKKDAYHLIQLLNGKKLDTMTIAQEADLEKEIFTCLEKLHQGSYGRPGIVMSTLLFPHYYRLNLLYWQLYKTEAHIQKMEKTLIPHTNQQHIAHHFAQ